MGELSYRCIDDVNDMIHFRNKKKLDFCACVEGANGVGKSVFTTLLSLSGDKSYTICPERILNKPDWQILNKTILTLPSGSYVHLDDCGELFYKRNFATRQQKDMNVFFMRSRKFIKNVFLDIPDFNDLDPYFRDNRVVFRFLIPVRGKVLMYQADTRGFGIPRWHMDEDKSRMQTMSKNKYKQDMTTEEYLNICRGMHGFCGEFDFPDFTPDQQKAYDNVIQWYIKRDEEAEKKEEEEENNKPEIVVTPKTIGLVKKYLDEGHSQKDAAEFFEISEARVSQIAKKLSLISLN